MADPKAVALSIQDRLTSFLSKDKGVKSVASEKPKLIRTGITNLDAILGGGIIHGGIVQLVGRAGCGKSSLASKFVSSFQKHSGGNCIALYIDTETTMTKFRLSQLGVNYPPIDPISDCTLEDIFMIIDSIVEFKKANKDAKDVPAIVVWDSIANTLTKKEFEAEDPKEIIGFKARMLSLYLPKITSDLQEYGITIVAINQLRDAVGIGPTPTPVAIKGMKQSDTIPGGRTLQFATSQLIYMSDAGNLEERIYGFDGKEVEMYCIKNKAFPPLIKTKTSFSYMGGYSNFWSAFSVLKENKVIVVSGAWYSMAGYANKFQASKVAELYVGNVEFKTAFDGLLATYVKEIADKYQNQLESCNIDDIITSSAGGVGGSILELSSVKETMSDLSDKALKTFDKNQTSEAEAIENAKQAQKAFLEKKKALDAKKKDVVPPPAIEPEGEVPDEPPSDGEIPPPVDIDGFVV